MGKDNDMLTAITAAVRVGVANTANIFMHPIHTVKVIVGLENDKSIPEMIEDEQARITAKRKDERQG